MDAIAVNVLRGLTSLALDEFKLLWNAKDDAQKMKNTVHAIRCALLDAEAKAKDHQVNFWMERLKDTLYDVDDLLDDLSTESLKRQLLTQNMVTKKVRIFFSKSNQFIYDLKMGHKMRNIRKMLDEIDDEKKRLKLNDQPLKPSYDYEERKQTYSFVPEDEIIGRDVEKSLLIRYVLNPAVKSKVSVIPIVGFGGLGKTALAQLVCNHGSVRNHFELKRWVCVSDEFDARQIAQKILGAHNTNDMEQVQQDLRQSIQGKKFLIVLDDVWNEDAELWLKVKSLLMEGAHGSKIIVTTRSVKVAEVMGTDGQTITLQGLSEDRSWRLFCRMAYGGEKESNDEELAAIGREIVKKCAGVPLAIRIVGRLVYDKTSEGTDLSYLRKSELWNMEQVEERIFGVLKLSYDHLSSPMKNCVAFCSLFPKDFSFNKKTLIQMWIAEGFIQSLDQMRCEEDVGHEFFMNLLSRCFFQDVTRNKHGDIETCKMHDLIHDLAQFLAKNEYLVVNGVKEQRIRGSTRHLSYDVLRNDWKVPTSTLKSVKLRTVLLLKRGNFTCKMDGCFGLVASRLNCLRVLVLHSSNITKIPTIIGKLKHLRFLDLSHNHITHLPRDICSLHNLQTLILSNNDIVELPRDIRNLVNLRHIQFDNCTLMWMPHGLGKLTSLQTLTEFVVGGERMQLRRDHVGGIAELGELNNLRGSLQISGLKHLRHNPEEAESAKLKDKQHLQHLTLVWSSHNKIKCVGSKFPGDEDELILQRLLPHENIKSLVIKGFCGESLPEWIGNLKSLQYLEFHDCFCLATFPEVIRNVRSLKRLIINGSPMMEETGQLPSHVLERIYHIPSIILSSDYLN